MFFLRSLDFVFGRKYLGFVGCLFILLLRIRKGEEKEEENVRVVGGIRGN